MSAFDEYIEKLVNGEEDTFEFPKNESSWEELFEFGRRRITEIVALKVRIKALEDELEDGAMKNALDSIAEIVHSPGEWQYPGQVVNDVKLALSIVRERNTALETAGRGTVVDFGEAIDYLYDDLQDGSGAKISMDIVTAHWRASMEALSRLLEGADG